MDKLKLYLGAGRHRLDDTWLYLDRHPFEGIDVVCDATQRLPFDDNSFIHVYSQDFLEHLPPEKKVHIINEIWRILKPDGVMEHYVPNAGSRNDFGSPTHLSHWSLQQFEHFDVNSYRYEKDREYEGFVGGFKKDTAELLTLVQEEDGLKYQSIHIVYQAVK